MPEPSDLPDDALAAITRLIDALERIERREHDPKRRQEEIHAAIQAVNEEAHRITVEFESRVEFGPLRWLLRFRSSGVASVIVAILGLGFLALVGGVIGYFLRSR